MLVNKIFYLLLAYVGKDAPKLVIAFNGSKPFQVNAFNADMHLLGDMLIELALKIGVRKMVRAIDLNCSTY